MNMVFNGLTDKQAEKSRAVHGRNRCAVRKARTFKAVLREHIGSLHARLFAAAFLLAEAIILIREVTYEEKYNVLSLFLLLLWQFLAGAAAVFIAALFEYISEKGTERYVVSEKENTCHVYRCGNTITDLPSGDIVVGDYVLLQAGDVVPADAITVWGDITVLTDNGERLVRAQSDEDERLVYSGSPVTTGNAVVKITAVGDNTKRASERSTAAAYYGKSYRIVSLIGYAAALATLILFAVFRIPTLDGMTTPLAAAVLACGLFNSASVMLMFCGRIKNPEGFFQRLNLEGMSKSTVYPHSIAQGADLLLVDKSVFVTDGKARAGGFVDGTGSSYTKFSEIPYPLGTLLAAAIAESTPALSNRGNFYCSTAWKRAELEFISGRIKRKSDLFCSAKDISDVEKVSWTKLICGYPADIIPKCKHYYDKSGALAPITNPFAIGAMSDELYYQGSRVVAFADEISNGVYVLIGFLTIQEKLRAGASVAFRAMIRSGMDVILLADDSLANAVSLADKAVTGATSREIVPADKIASMSDFELGEFLPSLRIVTGKADRERIIRIAAEKHLVTASTAITYEDVEAAATADVIYASDMSCAAAKQAADSVVSGGVTALRKADIYNRLIRRKTVVYEISQLVISVVAAVLTVYFTVTGKADIVGGFVLLAAAVVNTLIPTITGGGIVRKAENNSD